MGRRGRDSLQNIYDFISSRTREAPFIGHLIAGDNFNDQTIWYSCILYAIYGIDLMPTPEILE